MDPAVASSYPVELELDAPLEIANWRPLVQWFLAIPHLIVANLLGQVAWVLGVVSWVSIVFTGNFPQGLVGFQCLAIRYQARAVSYMLWLREPYPAFDFTMTAEEPGNDPLRVSIRPQLTDRNRLTVGLRFIWIIPIAIYVSLLGLVASVALFIAFFAVLFTGRWPEGIRTFIIGTARVSVRLSAYGYLLVDEYPPFALD